MKHTLLLSITLLTILTGCTQSSKKSTSTSTNNPVNSNGVSADQCIGNAYYTYAGCAGYCAINPTSPACSGSSTGSTSGGSYGTVTNNDWGARYNAANKPTIPSSDSNCGTTTGGYGLRKATVGMAFGNMYSPGIGIPSSYSAYMSSFLLNVNEAKGFFDSDSILKLRFVARPQPDTQKNGPKRCFDRTTGISPGYGFGYTQLTFKVALQGVKPDGSLDSTFRDVKSVTTNLSSCSTPVDFSNSSARNLFPDGVVAVIYDVNANLGCSAYPCNSPMNPLSTAQCWELEMQAQVDGTVGFN